MLMSILKSGWLKKTALWILTIAITFSSFVSVPISFGVLAEESGIPYLEIKPGAAWTSVIYRADSLTMNGRGYFKFSFDYKVTSGEPVFQIQGYDAKNQKYVALADLCSAYDEQDVVENNIMKRVITLRVKSTSFTGIMITLGAYSEANDIGCVVANPELYRYTNNTYSILHYSMTDNLLNDMSEENIYDVMAEDPVHKFNQEGKWNLRYLSGKRSTIEYAALTHSEYAELFAPPKYMIRLYEGNQNTDIEYIDRELDLQPGTYTLECNYKSTLKTADFTVAVSDDNGATFQNIKTTVTDSANSRRKVEFTLSEDANALKITVGNLSDRTDVSIVFANPSLMRSGEDTSLIRPITADAVALIDLNDTLTDETWNVRRDSENAEAVGVCKIPDGYFSDEKESLLYETYAGCGWTSILYSDESVFLSAGKSYLFTADFKLKSGSLSNDQIGVTYDPFFGILVDTMNTAGYGKDIYISTKNADYFNGVTTEFDEAQGKVIIRFSPMDDLKGIMIRVGNDCETPVGSCAIANPKLMEYTTKLNGVTVYGDTMIKNITEDTVVNPKEGKSANSELGKWNTIHMLNYNSFHVGRVAEGYFDPENAYIKTQSSATDAKIEYTDHSTVFTAGTRYELSFHYRVYSGEPETVLSFKNIDGVAGEYVALTEKTDFISNFNDEIDEKSFVRTISFTPKKDISDFKLALGALSGQANVSVAIANAECYVLDQNSLKVGESLVAKINRPNTARNSAEEKVWNLVSANENDIVVSVPIPKGEIVPAKMVRIKSGYSWTRAVYYDNSLVLEPNTTYRFSADYIAGGGSPSFSMTFKDPSTNKTIDVSNFASSYNTRLDKRVAMRYIEFTTKPDISGVKGIEITIGNSTESTDISCVFANPTFTKVENGEPVGDNLIYDITDDTVKFMGNIMYDGTWNLRYLGSKNVALVLEDIPENYFRVPTLEVTSSNGSVTQFVTAKPSTNYALSFRFRNEGGSDCSPFMEGFSDSGSLGQIAYGQVTKDDGGYYNYYCEFKTPADLRNTDNIRVGILLDGVMGAYTGFELYELDSGFEKTGVNLIKNGSFENLKSLPVYDGTPTAAWVFEGSENHAAPSYRSNSYFKIPVPQVYLFAGGSEGNYIGRTLELTAGETYQLSFNLKYANPGYEGDTGVELTYNNGTEWVTLFSSVSESTTEFANTYRFTMPADAVVGQNMRFRIKAGSYFVSGSIGNAKLFNIKDMNTNLIENGDFSEGTTGWECASGFRQTYLYELPDGYFDRDRVKDSMVIYRNSGTWDNITQNYLALKSDTYYLLVTEAVQVWPDASQIESGNRYGADHSIQVSRYDEEGKRLQPFIGATKTVTQNNTTTRIYKTPTNLEDGANAYFRMVMQDVGDAGFWGSCALYESDENGNILSNNVLLNGDFSLGFTAWTISKRNDDADYRIVKQPDGFFENYEEHGPYMIQYSSGETETQFSQRITLERGKKYYFSGFYSSKKSSLIAAKIHYINKAGQTVEKELTSFYDYHRSYFEIEFELPNDAYSFRGLAEITFFLPIKKDGKVFFSDLALYESGEYTNLLTDGLTGWETDGTIQILPRRQDCFLSCYYGGFDKETGVLTIDQDIESGYGVPSQYAPWYDLRDFIQTLIIEDGVTAIDEYAFRECTALTSVTIPNSVTAIGNYAFLNCASLTEITIPASVTCIATHAFDDCTALTSLTVKSGNPVYHSQGNCLIETQTKSLILGLQNSVIPTDGSVTSIGEYAFHACMRLTDITIPDNIQSIGDYAFSDCTALTAVTIPNGVSSIGDSVFFRCKSLTDVTIPTSVSSIGDWAFSVCTSLPCITIPNSVVSLGDHAFYSCTAFTSVTLPESVTSIGDCAFDSCVNLADINIPDCVENVGIGAFYNTLWDDNQPDGLIYVGKVAYRYEGDGSNSVESREGTVTIADYAFWECSWLENVTIPDSVTSIGRGAFIDCWGLTSITIPDSVTSIGSDAFEGCHSLTIYCTAGSYTENYAKNHGIAFRYFKSADLDGDGSVSAVDLAFCQQALLNGEEADVNGDGETNVLDLIRLKKTLSEQAFLDLDGDGKLDESDVTRVQEILATDGEADLNGDGVTNILDLIFMKKKLAA